MGIEKVVAITDGAIVDGHTPTTGPDYRIGSNQPIFGGDQIIQSLWSTSVIPHASAPDRWYVWDMSQNTDQPLVVTVRAGVTELFRLEVLPDGSAQTFLSGVDQGVTSQGDTGWAVGGTFNRYQWLQVSNARVALYNGTTLIREWTGLSLANADEIEFAGVNRFGNFATWGNVAIIDPAVPSGPIDNMGFPAMDIVALRLSAPAGDMTPVGAANLTDALSASEDGQYAEATAPGQFVELTLPNQVAAGVAEYPDGFFVHTSVERSGSSAGTQIQLRVTTGGSDVVIGPVAAPAIGQVAFHVLTDGTGAAITPAGVDASTFRVEAV